MPATNDEEIHNFEGNLEKAFCDFLLDNGLELASANDPQRLGDDYMGVQVSIDGLHEDEHMSEKPNGELEYDHYLYSVTITIHTDRQENALPGSSFSRYHRELVAKVRNLLSISRAAQVASLNDELEYYWINRLAPSGTEYTSFDSSYDETSLLYEGDFAILPQAWPT